MKKNESGQIVLMLVLITVVGLTIGLSLVSRTITDVRISSQIEQSSRAFSAAEAGIETALRSGIAIGPTGSVNLQGASANYSVQNIGGDTTQFDMPLTKIGNNQTVWLIGHNSDGTINESDADVYPNNSILEICFNNLNNQPAVSISLFYKEGTAYKIAKRAFDSITTRGNNLLPTDVIGPYCNGLFQNRVQIVASTDANPTTYDFGINSASKLLFMRLSPIYQSTAFSVKPTSNLPLQGKVITSIGQTQANIVRKIRVFQGYSTLPGLLDFTLFSDN